MKDKFCLCVFDLQLGPQAVFYQNIAEEEAKSIAMKSIFALCGIQDTIHESIDGVLPLPDQKMVFYTFIFPLKLKEENRGVDTTIAAFAFIVPKTDEFFLYNNIVLLKQQIQMLVDKISETYLYEPNSRLPWKAQRFLKKWSFYRLIADQISLKED